MAIIIDPNRLYHGVYPGGPSGYEDDITPELVQEYEDLSGCRVAWVYFSHNWYRGRTFPRATADWIAKRGSCPFIRLMLRHNGDNPCPDPEYSLKSINSGSFDRDLKLWGQAARDFGSELIVEWGTEVNGDWFAWNATWNGKQRGAKLFRDAFQRIVRIVRDECKAVNTTWVFHVNDSDEPNSDWNRIENYYPQDAYVDWLGMSVYGAQEPDSTECLPFAPRMKRIHDRLHAMAPNKPIFLLEFGATAGHERADIDEQCRPDVWAAAALHRMINDNAYPHLRGFSWWNERFEENGKWTDMRLQATTELSAQFRKYLSGNRRIAGRPIIG